MAPYQLDELRAAVLRVQVKKLPRIIKTMHHSKYRIRKALEKFPGLQLRKVVDPAGDRGTDAKVALVSKGRVLSMTLPALSITTLMWGPL